MNKEQQDIFYKDLGKQISIRDDYLKINTLYGLTHKIPSLNEDRITKRTLYNYKTAKTKIPLYNLIVFLEDSGEREISFKHETSTWKLTKQ